MHAAVLLAALVLPVRAFGPSTHAALSAAVVDRAPQGSPLGFLVSEPYRTLFIRASLATDLTASLLSGKAGERRWDEIFHDRRMARRMVALAGSDRSKAALALGWLSHVEADRAMSGPGSLIYRDLFGVPSKVRRQLATTFTAISKVSIDAMVIRDLGIAEEVPLVDRPLLVAAIRSCGARTPQEDPLAAVTRFESSFAWTCSALYKLAAAISVNTRAFPDLSALLADEGEQAAAFAGFDEVVDRMVPALEAAARAARPRRRQPEAGPAADPPGETARPAPGLMARAASKAGALTQRGLGYLWGGSRFTTKLRQSLVEQTLRLLASAGPGGSVGSRIQAAFAGEMINDTHSWSQVRARIRQIVTGPRDTATGVGEGVDTRTDREPDAEPSGPDE